MAFPTPYSSNYTIRPDGTRVSEASVPDLVTPSAQPTNDDWLQKILDRTEEMYEREERGPYPSYRPMPSMGSKGTKAISGRRSLADSGHNQSPQEKELGALALLAKRKELEAMMSPPPMRMTTFASGANNGYTPDVSAMSGIQRQIYLPKESSVTSGGLTESQMERQIALGATKGKSDPSWNQKAQENQGSVENAQTMQAVSEERAQMQAAMQDMMRTIQQLKSMIAGGSAGGMTPGSVAASNAALGLSGPQGVADAIL
jgi:hypothetical protein